jgi:SAM-dependent methyltransferase
MAAAAALAICAAVFPPAAAQARAAQDKPKGRLFPPQDLGLIQAPDREQWQKPDLIMDVLQIAEGSVVADLGAGGGWFTVRLARRVGPNGLVYGEDIQPAMIEAIARRVQEEGLQNVRTVLGTPTDPRLPSKVDAVLIVDVYKEMDDPVTVLKNVVKSLNPQGRIGVVGYNAGSGGPGPEPDQRVDPQTVIDDAAQAGLQLTRREPVPPFQFLLVFAPAPAAGKTGGTAPAAGRPAAAQKR